MVSRFHSKKMSRSFEEIDHCETPLGELTLRRRRIPLLDDEEVFEVILNEEFLMSSLFHVAEEELSRLGLAACPGLERDVVVGGLGLGYMARAALEIPDVRSVMVVDALAEVIGWHQTGKVPLGAALTADPRCRMVHADFFERMASAGLDPDDPGRRFHAILLDIDHTPRHLLHPKNAAFYGEAGLRRLAHHLHPGGVFAMWADGPPDADFLATLGIVFIEPRAEVVTFSNPIQNSESSSTVYVARRNEPQG